VFVVGLLAGGLCTALLLGLASGLVAPVPPAWRYAAVVGVALLGLLRDLGAVRIPLPQNARQVPQGVLRRHLLRGSFQFGFELGTGVRTFVSATSPYVLAVALLLVGQQLPVAVLAGLGFGAGRAATPVLRRLSGAAEVWDDDLRARLPMVKAMAAAVLLAALVLILLGPAR
jgi:hypothetical protein